MSRSLSKKQQFHFIANYFAREEDKFCTQLCRYRVDWWQRCREGVKRKFFRQQTSRYPRWVDYCVCGDIYFSFFKRSFFWKLIAVWKFVKACNVRTKKEKVEVASDTHFSRQTRSKWGATVLEKKRVEDAILQR